MLTVDMNIAVETKRLQWRAPGSYCRFVVAFLIVLFAMQTGMLPASGKSKTLEVAVFKDFGVGPSFDSLVKVLRKHPSIHLTILNGEDVRDGALKNFDVFMVPGGSGRKEARSLESFGKTEIKRYVRDGGCYVGICAGCYLAADATDFLGLLPLGIRDRRHWCRGKTTLPIEFTDAGVDVFGVERPLSEILYHNGPILDSRPLFDDKKLAANVVPLAFFRSEIVADGGERGVMKNAPAMVLARYGKGLVLGISPHPEQTPSLHKTIPHALHWLRDHVDSTTIFPSAQSSSWQQNMDAGKASFDRRHMEAARMSFSVAVKQAEKFGPHDKRLIKSINSLADVFFAEYRYKIAAPKYVQVVAMSEKEYGPNSEEVVRSLSRLAQTYLLYEDFKSAEPVVKKAFAIAEKELLSRDLGALKQRESTAEHFNNIGICYLTKRKSNEALKIFDEAIRLNPKYAMAYQNRGVARRNIGNSKGADEDERESQRLGIKF